MINPKKKKNAFRKFLRFSGIGIQLGVMMYLSSLLGGKLDTYFNLDKPWFSLALILLVLIVFVMNLMRQLNKLNDDN